jgi:hypothetical protein
MTNRCLGVLAAFSLLTGPLTTSLPPARDSVAEPHGFLRTAAGFTPAEIARLDRGEPLAKVLDTDRREVAVVGAVRIAASPARLFDRFRDIATLRSNGIVMEIGRFGTPPAAADLRGLHLEDYDLEAIRACKPGNCGVRLSTANLERFAHDVNWNAPNWRQQAGDLWRRLLAADAVNYLATGTLGDYRNKAVPLDVADEFKILFDTSQYFQSISPEFIAYLRQFPNVQLAGTENILYWSKDDINRPVTRITHLSLYPAAAGSRRPGLIASKQIYAAHYFDAGLGLTCAFDDGASGFYMLSLNRVRTRSLTSFMRGLVRSMVQRRSRDAMEEILRSTKSALERLHATGD